MSSILQRIIDKTETLYKQPNMVIDWNEWVFNGHNKVVDYWILEIAKKYKFDVEACRIAAYLHDISYAWMSKNDPTQEKEALIKARQILEEESLDNERIDFIVDGIIAGHGMHEGQAPELMEAKVFATADALSHFTTDFYVKVAWEHYLFEDKTPKDYKAWVLKKIDRDINNKIFFEDFREIAKPYYEALKTVFSNPSTLPE